MKQPTKEEVEGLKRFWWSNDLVMRLCDAYLAQEEALKARLNPSSAENESG